MAVVTAAREADKATKEVSLLLMNVMANCKLTICKQAERKRRAEKRKRKEENAMRSAQKVVISNPKKLARMSRKQFLRTVHVDKK